MRAPCADCQDRRVGCHTDCERYKEFRAERDAYLARERYSPAADVRRIAVEKTIKRRRKR